MSESTCQLCAAGALRLLGEHVRVSLERGEEKLGPCPAPDVGTPRQPEKPFLPRLAAWAERMRALGKDVPAPPPLLVRPWCETEREPGEDDDDEAPMHVLESGGASCP